jgi:signal transduction histidine kinase
MSSSALGGIASALELITEHAGGALGTREHALLIASRDSANGLFEFCERTLDFERMIEGGVDLVPTTVAIAEVIGRAVAPWRVQAELKGLGFRVELPPEAARVDCDPVRLTQIVQNLVGNAVKFTTAGSIAVEATLEEATTGAPMLRLRVVDTGPGITAADRERLFQPFAQGDAGKARRRGLSIASRIAQAMGGSISLEGTSTGGSTFQLLAPLSRSAAPASASPGGVPAASPLGPEPASPA